MNIKDFKSGTLRQEYQYKSFIPEMINHTFTWDDPQINTMLEDATRALGETKCFYYDCSKCRYIYTNAYY